MRVAVTHRYPCTPDTLLGYFVHPQEIQAKYHAVGAEIEALSATEPDPCHWYVESRRKVASNIPALLKAVMGSHNTLHQTEQWRTDREGNHHCDLTVKVMGVPATIRGTMAFVATKDGCENRVVLSIKGKGLMIGAVLEQFLAEDSKRLMEQEYRYLLNTLAPDAA